MSVDTYFCFCCLSTNDLTSLFSCYTDKNYASILEDIFSIKPSQEESEDDSYICELCKIKLGDAYNFKIQVLETLNILQVNGLINIHKTNEKQCVIEKLSCNNNDLEEKYTVGNFNDRKMGVKNMEDTKSLKTEQILKLENQEIQKLESVVNETLLNIILEEEKRTNARKKKKEQGVVKDLQYEITKDFSCKLCPAVLPNMYVYHRHMNQHFPNHICETCGKGFLTEKRLKRHTPSHKSGPFKCDICDAEFRNYNTLCSHRQRKHTTVELYKCPHCPERFTNFGRRAVHLSTAHAEPDGKYVCSVCKKRFLLAGNLSSHMRATHLQVKRHFCSYCGMGFFQKEDLKGHTVSHTGLNEFRCSKCPKRYPRKKALIVHMRTHTNDRRFCCDICGKKFLQKCTLTSHFKTHNQYNDDINKCESNKVLVKKKTRSS